MRPSTCGVDPKTATGVFQDVGSIPLLHASERDCPKLRGTATSVEFGAVFAIVVLLGGISRTTGVPALCVPRLQP
jgi:hypothetical protein